jgi:hypothetical protein
MPIVPICDGGPPEWSFPGKHGVDSSQTTCSPTALSRSTDFHLIHITYDVDDAVRHISNFYRNFHSYRWVREKMVIRIQHALSEEAVVDLNNRFDGILASGSIDQTTALAEEADDQHLQDLPRIILVPHKRDFGTHRLLLDAINEAQLAPV